MAKVFLSYAKKDHFFAELAFEKLSQNKIDCWRDRGSLQAGDYWRDEIDRGIAESAAIIVALSPSAASSAYVTYEWASAIGKEKVIIPLLIEACDRHPRLEPIQYLDFTNANYYPWVELVNRLNRAFEEAEAPEDLSFETDEFPGTPSRAQLEPVVEKIDGYLNERGFQMVSFERINKSIDGQYSQAQLKVIPKLFPDRYSPARLKGGKEGIKRL